MQKRLFEDEYRVFYDPACRTAPRTRPPIWRRNTSPWCTSRCARWTWTSGWPARASQRRFRVMVPGFAGLAPFLRGSNCWPRCPACCSRTCCAAWPVPDHHCLPAHADVHGLAHAPPPGCGPPVVAGRTRGGGGARRGAGACRSRQRSRGRLQVQIGQPGLLARADPQLVGQVVLDAAEIGVDRLECRLQELFLHAPQHLQGFARQHRAGRVGHAVVGIRQQVVLHHHIAWHTQGQQDHGGSKTGAVLARGAVEDQRVVALQQHREQAAKRSALWCTKAW
jgi:hypothetical protein